MTACRRHVSLIACRRHVSQVRYVYMSFSNAGGESGSPPIGWQRLDLRTGEVQRWLAPPRTFCEEVVVVPKAREAGGGGGGAGGGADVADAWLAAMFYDADRGVSGLAILDAANVAAGPVCRLWLRQGVPHGLHGCFVEGALYGRAGDETR